jgi:2-succinyl-5-enolpyruvyl-6-hydroxy-3-cyclohexene-1-carboxylate synthase
MPCAPAAEDDHPIFNLAAGAVPEAAEPNLGAALTLLEALIEGGLQALVLCPGSRSAPLAQAAGLLEPHGLRLFTAIDERSAAFFAVGLARAAGQPVAVVTTSGTAVANLLPAAVEADMGGIPLLLLSADRPARLKGCGANQTVNQEAFLNAAVRWLGQGDPAGLDRMQAAELRALAAQALAAARGSGGQPAGAVHLNLPFEEPLHATADGWLRLRSTLASPQPQQPRQAAVEVPGAADRSPLPAPLPLDPDRAGVVVAGPWRGTPQQWPGFVAALQRWLQRSGWPLLADGLSGLRGLAELNPCGGYDLLLNASTAPPPQILRLGPLPASRRLQDWLQRSGGEQRLISQGDPRPLDPLAAVQQQWAGGLEAWCDALPAHLWRGQASAPSLAYRAAWQAAETALQRQLVQAWHAAAAEAAPRLSEPWLAYRLAELLPPQLPLVLANSSPVRDWESFAFGTTAPRPVLGFRGASGIDGTLSLACGVAEALGQALLLTGDLALLHDSNGWLWRQQLRGRLTVVLLNNGGGGIFEQLPIRQPGPDAAAMAFERLFAMPQHHDALALAAAHGVPGRQLQRSDQLEQALAWALEQPLALLEVCTDRQADAALRRRLRTMAAALFTG